jgi:hypothetical protein
MAASRRQLPPCRISERASEMRRVEDGASFCVDSFLYSVKNRVQLHVSSHYLIVLLLPACELSCIIINVSIMHLHACISNGASRGPDRAEMTSSHASVGRVSLRLAPNHGMSGVQYNSTLYYPHRIYSSVRRAFGTHLIGRPNLDCDPHFFLSMRHTNSSLDFLGDWTFLLDIEKAVGRRD